MGACNFKKVVDLPFSLERQNVRQTVRDKVRRQTRRDRERESSTAAAAVNSEFLNKRHAGCVWNKTLVTPWASITSTLFSELLSRGYTINLLQREAVRTRVLQLHKTSHCSFSDSTATIKPEKRLIKIQSHVVHLLLLFCVASITALQDQDAVMFAVRSL